MKVPRHPRRGSPSWWRPLAVATSVITAVGLIGSAAASPASAAEPPDQIGLTEADLAQVAAGTAAGGPLTLLTGDTVQVGLDADGNPTVQQIEPAPRPDGTGPVAFHTVGSGADTHVVPDDALPLLAEGLLDWELFNLRELAKLAANGVVGRTPVLVTYSGPATASRAAPMAGTSGGRSLPSIDGTALTIDGSRWWPTVAGTEPGRVAAGPLAGVEKIWLDGLAEITLEESVPQVGAPVAWARGLDGTGVTVAVLDTGVDMTHPDLAGQVVEAVDFTGNPDGPVDGHGHGTHVAATIAGTGAASGGLRKGVAPGAQVLIGKVCGDNGSCPTSAILDGMEWAAASGAPVVSMSLGSGPSDGTDVLSQSVNDLSQEHGTLFVIAAGNSGPDRQTIGAPGAADAALTVGAVDKQDEMASFSSRGPRRGDLAPKPDLVAPGVGIVAARAAETAMGSPVDEDYTAANGTSMATPHVSGAAAILAQQSPDLTGEQLKALLMSTTADLGFSHHDQGAGRLDVAGAVDSSVFVAGSGSLGRYEYPHEAVTRSLTYHNLTDFPVTLDLDAALTGPDGDPAAAGLLTLSAEEITVPAGGTTEVSMVMDGGLLGEDGPFGGYRGSVDAVDADGELRVRTLVTAFLEPQRFPVTLEAVPPDGATDVESLAWLVIPVDDQTSLHPRGFENVTRSQVDLFPGTYAVVSRAISWRDPDGHLNQALVTAPEVTVIDQPQTVRLDLRKARPVRVDTPDPTEIYHASLRLSRASVGQDWSVTSRLTGWHENEEARWWTLPTEPVTLGSFSFDSRHVLAPSTVEMRTFGSGFSVLHPRYGTADVTASGGRQQWQNEDGSFQGRTVRLPVPRLAARRPVRLVDAGAGLPEELAAATLTLDGAVALIRPADICPVGGECDFPALRARVADAADRGAIGVLVAGEAGWVQFAPPDGFVTCPDGPDSCPPVEPYAPIPILRIPADQADDLLSRLARGQVRAQIRSQAHLPRVYALGFRAEGRVPAELPHRVGHRDLDRVEHRFHADQPGEVSTFTWVRVRPTEPGVVMTLPRSATQRTLTMLVQRDPDAVHAQEVQTTPYLAPHLLPSRAATNEKHAYVVDKPGRRPTVVPWNRGPIVPGAVVAPATGSGFRPPINNTCPGCREGDVFYPGMYLTTADGHRGAWVGAVNDSGLVEQVTGITPCEPPVCRIRLYDQAGNELEQHLVEVVFRVGDGQPTTTEEVDR